MQIEYDLHLTVFDTKVVEAAFRHYIRLCKANVAKGKGRPWSTHWVALNALLKDMKQSEREAINRAFTKPLKKPCHR